MPGPFAISNYLEKKVLSLLVENTSFTPPSTVYCGLFTAFTTSADGDTYTEVSTIGTGYARQPVTFSVPSLSATSNTATFDFPVATANYGTVTYFGVFDAFTGGNVLYWGSVSNATAVNTGQQFEVQAGQLQLSYTGATTDYANNAILNHTLRNVAFTPPTTVYTALLTAYTSDLIYTENADANYARQASTFSVPTNTVTSVTNSADISFPAAANTYTAVFAAVFDAASGGNMLLRAGLTPSAAVPTGKVFKFPSGTLAITDD